MRATERHASTSLMPFAFLKFTGSGCAAIETHRNVQPHLQTIPETVFADTYRDDYSGQDIDAFHRGWPASSDRHIAADLQGDSIMALVTFSLMDSNYTNIPASEKSLNAFLFSLPPKITNNATTVLIVDVDESKFPEHIEYEFRDFEIVFHTEDAQSLYLPLICYDDRVGTTSPRFHIYDLSSEAPILSVEHSSDGKWNPLPQFSVFPTNSDRARIRFGMEQIRDKRYKLNIGIWDTVANKRVDCDPLVGNDPP